MSGRNDTFALKKEKRLFREMSKGIILGYRIRLIY
jgi:hypothetical protein